MIVVAGSPNIKMGSPDAYMPSRIGTHRATEP